MLATPKRCRARRRQSLVWACLRAARVADDEPLAGQFKLAQQVTVHGKAGKPHHYMLKRGASVSEVNAYHFNGSRCYTSHRTHRGDGQTDLLREVEAQELRLMDRRLILGHVAWAG